MKLRQREAGQARNKEGKRQTEREKKDIQKEKKRKYRKRKKGHTERGKQGQRHINKECVRLGRQRLVAFLSDCDHRQ